MIASAIPTLVLISNILFVIFLIAIIFRKTWGKVLFDFLGANSVLLGFLIALVSVIGSLFYSNIMGFDPCLLCWWQRIFLYPQVVIFSVALKIKDKNIFKYIAPLASIALIISLYQLYLQMGGSSIIPCSSTGTACSKVFVNEYGYITIPFMSLTVSAYILLLAWVHKLYEKNSNSR